MSGSVPTTRDLWSFIWRFIRPKRGSYLAIFLIALLWAVDATVWPYLLHIVIDLFTAYDTKRDIAWQALQYPAFAGLGLWILIELAFRLKGYLFSMKALPELEADIRMAMFDHIQRHSPRYFNDHMAGSLANKITDMTTQVTSLLQQLFDVFLPALATCILGAFFYAQINSFFAFVLSIWIFVHLSLCFLFARKCDAYEHLHGQARSQLLGKIVDSLSNHFAVNLFYRFRQEKSYIGRFQKIEKQTNYQSKKFVEVLFLLLSSAFVMGIAAVNGLMIYFWIQNKLTTGEAAQIFNMTWNIVMMVWMAGTSIPEWFQSTGTAKQALAVMKDPQDLLDLPEAKPLQITQGQIVFKNVSFHYGHKPLFKNKNLCIPGGQKIGLVGYSGSGKTTFLQLILRFYPLEKGQILIDGQDISQVTLSSLRHQIALIPQDPILFHRSIKENIRFGKATATDEEVIQAAQRAHCDAFIQKLDQKYDTIVGERGSKLSGGERQRIAIARAILSNAPILILDEATSALDSVTEQQIQESLETLMQGRTTIAVAHRLSTLSKMDRILVFDQGNIIEEGAPQELLQQKGHYAHLWSMQAGGFLPECERKEVSIY